jgi:hypothetical protein
MRNLKNCAKLICFLFAAAGAGGQNRKPGLYDVTITTTTVSPSPNTYPPRTIQACLTQEMIEKYGAIVPEFLSNPCQLTNIVKKPGGMSADMVCSGRMTGKGTLAVNWTDGEHSKGNLHFSGSMLPGDREIKIEWTAVTVSAYKGPDCGDLKPANP